VIQKHQRIVFWSLVLCILAMAGWLFYERERGRQKVHELADATPIDAPTATTESVTLDLANDTDGTLTAAERQIALPAEHTARARALIDHLVAEYALPGSDHPLSSGAAVNEVFLVALPLVGHAANNAAGSGTTADHQATLPVAVEPNPNDPTSALPNSVGGELAVIDLRGAFVSQHPSGVEVESLTLLSIVGTLHANLPQIEQIRFLVDGQPRETLAGHADLLRTYPSRDTTTAAVKPMSTTP
jgi:hypothetical protein